MKRFRHYSRLVFCTVCLILLFLLTGCTSQVGLTSALLPDEGHTLTVYTSHKAEVYEPLIREFESRTGIWVTVVTGGTNELLEAIASEGSHPQADVMFGGGVETLLSYPELFSSYTPDNADAVYDSLLEDAAPVLPFSTLPMVMIYNPKLVSADRLQSWSDLLSPDFTGRIAFADPSVSGSAYTALVTILSSLEGDPEENLKAFTIALDGRLSSSSGSVITDVTSGECLVGIVLEETALRSREDGSELAIVYPAAGTSAVPDGTAIIKNCEHPENAALFLDFTLDASVQAMLSETQYRRSVRSDIPAIPDAPALSDLSLIDYDVERAIGEREQLLSGFSFFFRQKEETK